MTVINFQDGFLHDRAVEDARGMAEDMELEYVRTLSKGDLAQMAHDALDEEARRERRDQLRSFRNADLIIETRDGVRRPSTSPSKYPSPPTTARPTGRKGTPNC